MNDTDAAAFRGASKNMTLECWVRSVFSPCSKVKTTKSYVSAHYFTELQIETCISIMYAREAI